MAKKDTSVYELAERTKARRVSLDSQGIYHIEAKNDSTAYKRKYNRFVTETSDNGFLASVREKFNSIQASAFSKTPHAIAQLLSKIATPTPTIKKYGNFLDIGCSSGLFMGSLPKEWKAYGVEISDKACEIARERGLNVVNGTLETYKPKQTFDFMRASHVIEHVTEYESFLKRSYQIMKPKGRYIIYTPNSASLSRHIFGRYWEGFYDATHFTIFNLDNLGELAEKAGFKIVTKTTYEIGYLSASTIRLFKLVDSPFGSVLFWVLLAAFYPIGMITRLFGMSDALYIELEK